MSGLEQFQAAIQAHRKTKLRGSWLAAMFLEQEQALELVSRRLDRPGLELVYRAVLQAAALHLPVAAAIPTHRKGKPVGKPIPEVLTAYAGTLGLVRTREEMDGLLATGLQAVAVSRILIELVQGQARFGADLSAAIDQAAALSSALDRAEAHLRQFGAASSLATTVDI